MAQEIDGTFQSWPMSPEQLGNAAQIRDEFRRLLDLCSNLIPNENARYMSIVNTKLEEACMFALKGIAKPTAP